MLAPRFRSNHATHSKRAARARHHCIQQDAVHPVSHGGLGRVHPRGVSWGFGAAGPPGRPCGWRASGVYDSSVRRWRHLDLGASKLLLEAQIRRLHCQRCQRVRTEQVAWARPRARHSRDFEDVVAWLAQRTDKTTITRLLRTSWETAPALSNGSWPSRSTPAG